VIHYDFKFFNRFSHWMLFEIISVSLLYLLFSRVSTPGRGLSILQFFSSPCFYSAKNCYFKSKLPESKILNLQPLASFCHMTSGTFLRFPVQSSNVLKVVAHLKTVHPFGTHSNNRHSSPFPSCAAKMNAAAATQTCPALLRGAAARRKSPSRIPFCVLGF
jgi:hypothetical protein